MSSIAIKLKPEELRSLSFTGGLSSYTNVGTAFEHPIVLFHLINNLDADILVSFFNAEDHLFVKTGSFVLYDVAANREEPGGCRAFERGTIIQVKAADDAPTSGAVYLSVFYADGGVS
jgi:uncharacterized protein YfaT (DUF1175 family)